MRAFCCDNAKSTADNYSECTKQIKAVQKQRQIILLQDCSGRLQCGNRRLSSAEESSRVQFYEEAGRIIYRQYSLVMWVLMTSETATRTCVLKWLSSRSGRVVKGSWIFSLEIHAWSNWKQCYSNVSLTALPLCKQIRKWNTWHNNLCHYLFSTLFSGRTRVFDNSSTALKSSESCWRKILKFSLQ